MFVDGKDAFVLEPNGPLGHSLTPSHNHRIMKRSSYINSQYLDSKKSLSLSLSLSLSRSIDRSKNEYKEVKHFSLFIETFPLLLVIVKIFWSNS